MPSTTVLNKAEKFPLLMEFPLGGGVDNQEIKNIISILMSTKEKTKGR